MNVLAEAVQLVNRYRSKGRYDFSIFQIEFLAVSGWYEKLYKYTTVIWYFC